MVQPVARLLAIPMLVWDRIRDRLDPKDAEAALLVQQVREMIPTIESGKTWFAEARDDPAFADQYRNQVLGLAPALAQGARRPWVEMIGDDAWGDRLSSPVMMRLLGALLVWQLAATVRAFNREGVSIDALQTDLFTAMVGDTEQWIRDEGFANVLANFPKRLEQVSSLHDLALQAPEPDPAINADDLIKQTIRVVELDHIEDAPATLVSQWRVMDVATIAVVYRSLGEQLQQDR